MSEIVRGGGTKDVDCDRAEWGDEVKTRNIVTAWAMRMWNRCRRNVLKFSGADMVLLSCGP